MLHSSSVRPQYVRANTLYFSHRLNCSHRKFQCIVWLGIRAQYAYVCTSSIHSVIVLKHSFGHCFKILDFLSLIFFYTTSNMYINDLKGSF